MVVSNSVMLISVMGIALLCSWLDMSANGFVIPSRGMSRTSCIRNGIEDLVPYRRRTDKAPRLSACRINQKKEKAARNMLYMRKYRKPGRPHRRR